MIIRTEAVVLRSIEYGETSRIVTLYTRQMGKLAVMAKGARGPRSRFGATLQPMSYTQIVFYHKPGRQLQNLTQSAHIATFSRLLGSLDKLTFGLQIIELITALMHEQERNEPAFKLLVTSLSNLNAIDGRELSFLLAFQLKITSVLGFSPAISRESLEAIRPGQEGVLALSSGAVEASGTAGQGCVRASRTALRAFGILAKADFETIGRMDMSEDTMIEVGHLIESYLRFHVMDDYPFRASQVIAQMKSLTSAEQRRRSGL